MNIEITEKEKTALSLLLGLRQKFAFEKKENKNYSADELHKLFSELITKINKEELTFIETLRVIPEKQPNEVWNVIDEQIERSTIKRYDWKKVFNNSLTQEILKIKKDGYTVSEALNILATDERVLKFLDRNSTERVKILNNLLISVHARYGENNTAIKIMETEE